MPPPTLRAGTHPGVTSPPTRLAKMANVWYREGHVTCYKPMRALSHTLLVTLGRWYTFYIGVAKLVDCKPGAAEEYLYHPQPPTKPVTEIFAKEERAM